MKLRDATFDDWEFLLNLRNDISTKKNSFNQDEIDEESHKAWLKKSLDNPKRKIKILHEGYGKYQMGMIREDHWEDQIKNIPSVTLSWAICPSQRGKGLGNKILKLAIEDRTETFFAEIKNENLASIKMTLNNGFIDWEKENSTFKTFKKRGSMEIISAIENVRSANNVNWMDLCRLAFTHAPKEAKRIMRRVNSHDSEIANLLKELSNE